LGKRAILPGMALRPRRRSVRRLESTGIPSKAARLVFVLSHFPQSATGRVRAECPVLARGAGQ
jgi:hypothetical protein